MTKKMCALLAAFGCLWLVPCYGQTEQKPKFDTRTVAQQLSDWSLRQARDQLRKCWKVPATDKAVGIWIAVKLKPDGMLDGKPKVLSKTKDDLSKKVANSATSAILKCQPFKLPDALYDMWKELDLYFDTEAPLPNAKSAAQPR